MTAFDRKLGLGASEAAGALGLNPYVSPTEVWMEKTGQGQEGETNLAMRIGTLLEEPVAQLYSEQTGRVVRRHRRACRECRKAGTEYMCLDSAVWDADHPYLFAHLDRETRDGKGQPWDVLEIKTSGWPGEEWGPTGTDQVPLRVAVQVAIQMRVTGYQRGVVAALLWGRELRQYTIPRDPVVEQQLLDELDHFWSLVQRGEPPVHPDHPQTGRALRRLYPREEDQPLPAPTANTDWALVQNVVELYQRWKQSEVAYKQAQVAMEARLGTLPGFEWDKGRITWRAVTQRRTDWERVAGWIGSLAVAQGVVTEEEWQRFVDETTAEETTRRFSVYIKRGDKA